MPALMILCPSELNLSLSNLHIRQWMPVSIGFRAGEYESHQDSPNQCLPNHYKPPLVVEATARSNQIASSFVLRRHRRPPVNWRSASNCIIMRKEISSTILDLGAIRLCLGIGAVGKPIRSSTIVPTQHKLKAAWGRYCRKSHRIRTVELEIETNESKQMVF